MNNPSRIIRDKHTHLFKYIFYFLVLCFCSCQLNSYQVYAAGTENAKITKVGVRHYMPETSVYHPGPWYSQGATLSKKYYIYTEWNKNNNLTKIVMCKRSNSSSCTRSSQHGYGHANSLYHQWGTNHFLVYGSGNSRMACWDISKKKPTKSIASCPVGYIGSGTHGVPQGSTKYGKYYLRIFGNDRTSRYITLYKKNGAVIKNYRLTGYIGEPEDVMVDGDTGIVYFSAIGYADSGWGRRYLQFYKVSSSSSIYKYIKPSKTQGVGAAPSANTTLEGSAPETTASDAATFGASTSRSGSSRDGIVDTIFFGVIRDNGKGCSVYTIINSILEFLTYGIGILGVLGIIFVGTQYLTAGGNEEQTRKAKRRLSQIVIGLVAYVLLWALANWLMPGGKFSTSTTCTTITSSQVTDHEQD